MPPKYTSVIIENLESQRMLTDSSVKKERLQKIIDRLLSYEHY